MPIKPSKKSLGQVFLITVFVISVAMFSSLLALAPVRTKVIQIKEMEDVYQAMANAEKALEIHDYYSKRGGLPFSGLTITVTTSLAMSCAFYTTTTVAECKETTISDNQGKLKIVNYLFETSTGIELFGVSFYFGYVEKISRTLTSI